MYNVIVRYSYVYNKHIILEEFSDELIRKSIWVFTSVVSGAICLVAHMLGMKADQYLTTVEEAHETPLYQKTNFIVIILVTISLIINIILTMALKRDAANLDGQREEEARVLVKTMKKIFAVLSFFVLIALLRTIIDYSPFVVPTLVYLLLDGILVAYIVNKDPLRKFAMKKLAGLLGINVNCSSNSVAPMLAEA